MVVRTVVTKEECPRRRGFLGFFFVASLTQKRNKEEEKNYLRYASNLVIGIDFVSKPTISTDVFKTIFLKAVQSIVVPAVVVLLLAWE